MRKLFLITALTLAAPALTSPAWAADLTTGTVLGTSMKEVKTNLMQMGYDVRKAEMEDGRIEAYAVKGNKMAEIYVDPTTGKISKMKMK
jgi:hypothetical protein